MRWRMHVQYKKELLIKADRKEQTRSGDLQTELGKGNIQNVKEQTKPNMDINQWQKWLGSIVSRELCKCFANIHWKKGYFQCVCVCGGGCLRVCPVLHNSVFYCSWRVLSVLHKVCVCVCNRSNKLVHAHIRWSWAVVLLLFVCCCSVNKSAGLNPLPAAQTARSVMWPVSQTRRV